MLSDVQAGKLIKGIYEFACSGVTPQFDDGMVQMAFSFIASAIARDAEKYEEKCRKNKEIAQKRVERQRKLAKENGDSQTLTNVTDNDSDIVNENDNDNDKGNDNDRGNDNELSANSEKFPPKKSPSPSEDTKKIVELYHRICSNFSRITAITPERNRAVKNLISRYSEEKISEMFEKANRSNFLNGSNPRSWQANFDWLINEANFLKVLEGNYDNSKKIDATSENDGFHADKYACLVNTF